MKVSVLIKYKFLLLGAFSFLSTNAFAHGSLEFPLSRVLTCFKEGAENPKSPACQVAKNIRGSQQFYDWNEVNIPRTSSVILPIDEHRNVHKKIIPDGKLCSAGRSKYAGLDHVKTTWPTTKISPNSNGDIEFVYRASAPHITEYFEFYITRENTDLSKPLKWDDFESFCLVGEKDAVLGGGRYRMTCSFPNRINGNYVIFNVWQRKQSQSQEAFYACSDVEIDNVVNVSSKPKLLPDSVIKETDTHHHKHDHTPVVHLQQPIYKPTKDIIKIKKIPVINEPSIIQTDITNSIVSKITNAFVPTEKNCYNFESQNKWHSNSEIKIFANCDIDLSKGAFVQFDGSKIGNPWGRFPGGWMQFDQASNGFVYLASQWSGKHILKKGEFMLLQYQSSEIAKNVLLFTKQ